jgi:trehalose synthase
LPRQSVRLIAPSIDPCSVKNADMPMELAAGILEYTGLADGHGEPAEAPAFHRGDLSPLRVRHRCDVLRTGPAPRLGYDQLVVHICRWDRIKDPIGVMRGFVEHTLPHVQAHLILAGSTVHAINDDPEEPDALDEVQAAWRALAHQQRARVTVACLPMHDVDENAAIVNALQRHADVVVKKSLEEGFGLGVTEALWKRRAVVASDVGGHRDQIQHQHSGLLVDPTDVCSFGSSIAELLADPGRASALGDAGHEVVKQLYLDSRQLAEWDELLAALAQTTNARRSASRPKLQIVRNRTHSGSPARTHGERAAEGLIRSISHVLAKRLAPTWPGWEARHPARSHTRRVGLR